LVFVKPISVQFDADARIAAPPPPASSAPRCAMRWCPVSEIRRISQGIRAGPTTLRPTHPSNGYPSAGAGPEAGVLNRRPAGTRPQAGCRRRPGGSGYPRERVGACARRLRGGAEGRHFARERQRRDSGKVARSTQEGRQWTGRAHAATPDDCGVTRAVGSSRPAIRAIGAAAPVMLPIPGVGPGSPSRPAHLRVFRFRAGRRRPCLCGWLRPCTHAGTVHHARRGRL